MIGVVAVGLFAASALAQTPTATPTASPTATATASPAATATEAPHPELDELHEEMCPCRTSGALRQLDAEETAESLALLVTYARAVYDKRA